MNQLFSLSPPERYELAQHLLDSLNESAAAELDEELIAQIQTRREEMQRGEQIVPDWRAALSEIEGSLPT